MHAVPHTLYVALARGEATLEAMAGKALRVADWFVRLRFGVPHTVANETYSQLRFDAQGRVDRAHVFGAAQASAAALEENAAWPTTAVRGRMRALLFGQAPSPDASCAAFAVN